MRICLVSSNLLFAETLINTCSKAVKAEIIQIPPSQALAEITAACPQVILIDESGIQAEQLVSILEAARSLPDARAILISLQNNEMTVVNSHRATIRKVEDLLMAIEIHSEREAPENNIEMQDCDPANAASVRAGAYSFLAAVCNRRPDIHLVRRLRALGVEDFLSLILEGGEDTLQGLQEISNFIRNAAGQPDEEVEKTLTIEWTRLFRGVQPGYGPPPPYEGVYLGGDGLQALQAVAHFYREHGVMPSENAGNRPDYIGLELDFLRYLCDRQADAWEKGEEEEAQKWQRAERDFLDRHLGRWAGAYCDRIREEAKTGFYRGFAHILQGMVGELAGIQAPASI